ncbi:isoprenoid synthase domain-containing protein [Flammula alnicola]|nr:isoprenoid synthase domain-containing protein [Flammula alnicola]
MSYAPTAEELKEWSKGPTLESLFGKKFPLSRDHPDWQKLEQENDQWVEENWQFDDKELRDYLMSSQLGPFSSMCFPFAEREKLLWICRLVTLLFCLDEDLDRHINLHLLPILKALTAGTKKPENNYAELAIDKCWRAIEKTSTPSNFRQFVQITHEYFDSHGQIPYENFEQYVGARRTNVGAYFMWACLRYAADINLTDEELANPLVKRLEDIAGFHVAFTNDLISYTKEYLTDTATNNILTLLQRNDGLTPAEAEAKLRREIKKAETDYAVAAREVLDHPVLGKNEGIRKLVLNIPYGMGGNAWWSLVTKRYNVDPVNHPLPQVQINIDPAMPYHPCAAPFLDGPTKVRTSVVKASHQAPYQSFFSSWSLWFHSSLLFLWKLLLRR